MASEVVYIRSSRRLSVSGWFLLHRARHMIQHLSMASPVVPRVFMHFHDARIVRAYSSTLEAMLFTLGAMTQGYMEEPTEPIEASTFDALVLMALLFLQSLRLPAMGRHTCLMCQAPVAARMPRQRIPGRVSVERRLLSSCGYWTLQEISLFPILRAVDRPRLCSRHASRYARAFEAYMGFVDRPVLTRGQLHRTFMRSAMQSVRHFRRQL